MRKLSYQKQSPLVWGDVRPHTIARGVQISILEMKWIVKLLPLSQSSHHHTLNPLHTVTMYAVYIVVVLCFSLSPLAGTSNQILDTGMHTKALITAT